MNITICLLYPAISNADSASVLSRYVGFPTA